MIGVQRCSHLFGLALATIGLLVQGNVRAAERLNVVLILADDLGRNDLGCYGSKYFRTPQLDNLAGQSVQFMDAYAACPVCSPTRASILTGKYPARLHLTDWLPGRGDRPDQKLNRPKIRQELPLEEVTLAERFKQAGYATASIGKWHLGGAGFGPEKQGFDVNIGGNQAGTTYSYFAPYKNKQGQYLPGLEEAPDGEYITDRLTAEAERFITDNRERPFFLYMPHYAVHTPLRAKEETIKKYPGSPQHGKQSHPVYAAMLDSLDECVGRILQKLEDLKLDERTIVLFTSDNGGLATQEGMQFAPTINSPLRDGKGYLYEGGIRAPLLVKAPGIKPAKNSTPVCSIDFLPTLLELCDLAPAKDIDGVSFAPLLKGGDKPPHEDLYWHYPHYANQGSRPGGAIRSGDWKLIEFYETGRRELYNVKEDPSESRNRAAENPEIVERLAAKLHAWLKETGAQMMSSNPDYTPNPQAKNGTITIPAKSAEVHGSQLRYEPLPHKNTLGFWTNASDWASFEFTLDKLGAYEVEILQGCGAGQGGSEVEFAVGDQAVTTTVKDTGGFQAFERREIGVIKLSAAGRQTLTVKAKSKPGVAVMDLREIVLRPAH
jgi:arylsulfatase A-like enzyme